MIKLYKKEEVLEAYLGTPDKYDWYKHAFDKYEINMQDAFPIKPLLKNKDLIYKQGQIFINPEKRYIMNEILLKLI